MPIDSVQVHYASRGLQPLSEFLTPLRAAIKSYHMKTRYVAERPHHTEFHKNRPFVVSSHGHPGFE